MGINDAGTHIGRYVVGERLGAGGMGVVHKGRHLELDRTVAIKFLHTIGDGQARERFRREAQAIAALRHPNIVQVLDFGEHDGTPYMVVEYVAGGALDAALVPGIGMATTPALALLRGIAAALDCAHAHGILHRDVKPANVLLGADGEAVLADFGLAKLAQQTGLTATGVTSGTPGYMAPEQVQGHPVSPATDQYSLGAMAFELLTGRQLFPGENLVPILMAHVQAQPEAPSSVRADLPPAADPVILRAVAKDPAARWPSCVDFITALEAALVPRPQSATTILPRFVESVGRRRFGRRAAAIAAAAAVLVLALGGAGVAAANRSQPAVASASASAAPAARLAGAGVPTPRTTLRTTATTPTPQPPSPTPGAATVSTPAKSTPTPAPTAAPTAAPPAAPTAKPTPTPTATPTPTPTPTLHPQLSADLTAQRGSGGFHVHGAGYGAGANVKVGIGQLGAYTFIGETTAGSTGSFDTTFTVPSSLQVGAATVTGCAGTSCASQAIVLT